MEGPANALELIETLRKQNGKEFQNFSQISQYLGHKARSRTGGSGSARWRTGVLYDLYPVKNVQDWGFDAETGDGVILYEDGSAYIADIFTTAEELYQYAGNEGSK